ncbi:MAG: ECF transporter S component [Clostridia bacterium]|nr:ECF transporter S component [Clostridia bacterium]
MSEQKNKARSSAYSICITAVFAALCCAATFIAIPLPIGYFNLGDIFVLLSGYCLGPVFGTIAAGFGSALADVLGGYVIYAPATCIIKAGMVLVSYFIYRLLGKNVSSKKIDFLLRFVAALLAEALMVVGYFVYDSLFLGYGLGAAASIPGNCLQGVFGIAGYLVIASALKASGIAKKFWG